MSGSLSGFPFVPFAKIAEKPGEWRLTEKERRALDRAIWVVTEKIHGANFSFITDGQSVRCAKRKALLEPGESFFAHERLLKRLKDRIIDCHHEVIAREPEASCVHFVQIYGEIFGGSYPHPDVPAVSGVQPVQTGVWYSPDIEFCGFDVAFVDTDGVHRYLNFTAAREVLEAAGVLAVELLATGLLTEALDYPVGFDSTIPEKLRLPPIQDNLAEGVVIKPLELIMVQTRKGLARPLLKKKNAAFAEDERFHQAKRWSAPDPGAATYALDVLEWHVLAMLNENRLHSVRSKLGPVAPGDHDGRSALEELVIDDVWDQLESDHGAELDGLSIEDRELLRSLLGDEAKKLVHQARSQA